jgi:hypothetical protein
MTSSLHRLIPFLPLFCSCQFWGLDSIQFLCSQAHILAGWRLETQLTLPNWTLLCNHFARTMQKRQPLYCWEGVLCNGSYSIVAYLFVVAGMCLLSHCLAMNIYSDFAIPVDVRHVAIYLRFRKFTPYSERNRVKESKHNFQKAMRTFWAYWSKYLACGINISIPSTKFNFV